MVKMSETIMCQRFIQNAWKKDLCSNCFKSKEDHVVLPKKKITYRWTSHVDNFPQHGILKDREKHEKAKLRTVSFRMSETEIIGFGGEEYSSDEEIYTTFGEECAINDTDNEEEDEEFRKLTQSNTDFNSIPANLKGEKSVDSQTRSTYSNLKLGKPLTDADGRRQTLQVSVEPFHNSVLLNGTFAHDRKLHLSKTLSDSCPINEKTDVKDTIDVDLINNNKNNDNHDDNVTNFDDDNDYDDDDDDDDKKSSSSSSSSISSNSNDNINCDIPKCSYDNSILRDQCPTTCNENSSIVDKNSVNTRILNFNLSENVNDVNECMKGNAESKFEIQNGNENEHLDAKYVKISNVLVNVSQVEEKKLLENGGEIAENIKNAKNMLEPLFRLNAARENKDNKPKLPISHTLTGDNGDGEKEHLRTPLSLQLITSKDLDIELDKPGSREMVGEPDGKADSDDSCDPSVKAERIEEVADSTTSTVTPAMSSVNPQRSFLHAFSKEKPKVADKPVKMVAAECSPKKKTTMKDLTDISTDSVALTIPKIPISFNSCHGNGSTKRQAPKPPSPKATPALTAPLLVQSVQTPVMSSVVDDLVFRNSSTKKCESPLMNGSRDAVSFLGENGPSRVKRRLNLEPMTIGTFGRNSLNLISISPDGSDYLNRYIAVNGFHHDHEPSKGEDTDATSITSTETTNSMRRTVKCGRSLSCDSIVTPNGHTLSSSAEKTRKYSGATIKVKSTLRRFLRFNNKDGEKQENGSPASVSPRRRIEIIHPLDLNKSSIEILRSAVPVSDTSSRENCLKKVEVLPSENTDSSPKTPPINYATCPTARPNKPPPPPRTQSLDQKLVSEISKPVRPPPPKSVHLRQPLPKFTSICASSSMYENLGESRQGIAPAKPQRASSMRDRARQITVVKNEENLTTMVCESEAAPECDRNQQSQLVSSLCERQLAPTTTTYCGSETESDLCYHSVSSNGTVSSSSEIADVLVIETETRKNKSIVYSSLEDNYSAVVVANHETLSQLLEQVNQATLVPKSLKTLQSTLHFQFNNFIIDEGSKIVLADWNFYNAKWNLQNVVLSVSSKHLGPLKSLPTWITLYPLVKFTDNVPGRYLKDSLENDKISAYITLWNEERIETIQTYCRAHESATAFSESGLLLTQLTNALKHLQACGTEEISLNEIFVCKRKSHIESKLLLLPINVDYINISEQNGNNTRISLCKCVSTVLNMLLPMQQITDTIKRILSDERAASLSQAKAVTEYWLWGPYNINLSYDRQTSLQRWLDLERATYLQKMVCKKPDELSLNEICHAMFLVRTNAKMLTEASYLLEKSAL